MKHTSVVFDLETDTAPFAGQVLVSILGDGKATVAFREQSWHTWSPPIESLKLEITTIED